MDAKNWAQILCKGRIFTSPLSYVSSPKPVSSILWIPDSYFPVLTACFSCCCFQLQHECGASDCFSVAANQLPSFYVSQPMLGAQQHAWNLPLVMPYSSCGCQATASLTFGGLQRKQTWECSHPKVSCGAHCSFKHCSHRRTSTRNS